MPAVSATQDGQATRVLPPNPIPDNTSPHAYLQWLVVFTQDELKNHTLEIVATGASAATPFCLWRVDVTTPVRSQIELAQATSSGGSNATASSTSTLGATSTSGTGPSSTSSASSRGPSTGALVGGVIGAIALTLLICGGLFFWYRRQHKHRYAPTDLDDDGA